MRWTTGRFLFITFFFVFLVLTTRPALRHSGFQWMSEASKAGLVILHAPSPNQSQTARLELVQRACHGYHGDEVQASQQLSSLYVNEKHKFIYCEVPKVACTNWKRILLVLSGHVNTSDPSDLSASDVHNNLQDTYLKKLSSFTEAEIEWRLKTYFKFMFVRDPLERLLSAYKNKFTLRYNTYFHERYGIRIIRRYRNNATAESLLKGNDVTFGEFIQYILDPNTRRQEVFNAHWRQFNELCLPCRVKYDFIGHFDSLDADIRAVLERLKVTDLVDIPKKPKKRESTAHALKRSYANVSSSDVRALWHVYSMDYKMFGFEYPTLGRSDVLDGL